MVPGTSFGTYYDFFLFEDTAGIASRIVIRLQMRAEEVNLLPASEVHASEEGKTVLVRWDWIIC